MAANFDDKYEYDRLDAAKRSFRLLSVRVCNDEVECGMLIHPLDSQISYDALSYVWGDSERTCTDPRTPLYLSILRMNSWDNAVLSPEN